MIRSNSVQIPEMTESETANQVKKFFEVMNKLDTQSHLKYLIKKFTQIGENPRAL